MIIKSFTAPTVAAALKMVRTEMGGDAVVLKTRVLAMESGEPDNRVEVTACIDESILSPGRINEMLNRKETSPKEKIIKTEKSNRLELEIKVPGDVPDGLEKRLDSIICACGNTEPMVDIPEAARPVFLNMLDADIPVEIARQLIEQTSSDSNILDSSVQVLTAYLNQFTASNIEYKAGQKILFAGCSGSGKTSALAKLATYLITEKKFKVTLSSLDDIKIAAYEELGSYADILDMPAVMFDELAERQDDNSIVLIDTPPLPVNPSKRNELIKKIDSINPDVRFLVFSVCNRSRDLLENINRFEAVKPDYLIAGHLDETDRWGAICTMAGFLEKPLAFQTNSPGGIGRLNKIDTAKIAAKILKAEVTHE